MQKIKNDKEIPRLQYIMNYKQQYGKISQEGKAMQKLLVFRGNLSVFFLTLAGTTCAKSRGNKAACEKNV